MIWNSSMKLRKTEEWMDKQIQGVGPSKVWVALEKKGDKWFPINRIFYTERIYAEKLLAGLNKNKEYTIAEYEMNESNNEKMEQ